MSSHSKAVGHTPIPTGFILHEHTFVSGPRSTPGYRNGVWTGNTFSHSHPGGDVPRTEDENTFELIVTDSALTNGPDGKLIPIGDTPIEALGFPAADRMMRSFGMRCIVRDERKAVNRGN